MFPTIYGPRPTQRTAPTRRTGGVSGAVSDAADAVAAEVADAADLSPASLGQAAAPTYLRIHGGSREQTMLRLASAFESIHRKLPRD